MAFYLFLLFTIVPLVELAGLVWLGGQTAWWVPILVILIDAVAGTILLRWQGLRTLQRIQEDLAAGRMPGAALVDDNARIRDSVDHHPKRRSFAPGNYSNLSHLLTSHFGCQCSVVSCGGFGQSPTFSRAPFSPGFTE